MSDTNLEKETNLAMLYLEQREAAAAHDLARTAELDAIKKSSPRTTNKKTTIDPTLVQEFERKQSRTFSMEDPDDTSLGFVDSPTNRRASLAKYLDRSSTAADQFRREEQQWLSEDALGFAPGLASTTSPDHNGDSVDSDDSNSNGSLRSRTRSASDYEENDEFYYEVEVHSVNESNILDELEKASENKKMNSSTKSKSLRSATSQFLDSDDEEDNGTKDNEDDSKTKTRTTEQDQEQEEIEAMVAANIPLTRDQKQKRAFAKAKLVALLSKKKSKQNETKFVHLFKHLLTHQNALVYRKKNIVRAFQTDCPVRFQKEWGISEGVSGDWVVWNETKGGDMYCIQDAEFIKNYVPAHRIHQDVEENDHKYIKNKTVLARRIGYPFKLLHAKKKEIIEGKRGDYVIQPENGTVEDQYIVLAHQFHEKYQVVGSFSEYTELLKGVIMVSPSKELKRANSSAASQMHLSAERYKVSTLAYMTNSVRQLLIGRKGNQIDDKGLAPILHRGQTIECKHTNGAPPIAPSTSSTSSTTTPPSTTISTSSTTSTTSTTTSTTTTTTTTNSTISPAIPRAIHETNDEKGNDRLSTTRGGTKQVNEPCGTSNEIGVGSWDFDLFQLSHESRHWPLFHLAHHLFFARTKLITTLGINPELMSDFLAEIDDTYLPVAYHNNMHGADVLHGCNLIVERTKLAQHITPTEHFSFLIAGMCHDLSHPGTNNMFQMDSQSKIALKYNDCSVLENFHITTTFEILRQPQYLKLFPSPKSDDDDDEEEEKKNTTSAEMSEIMSKGGRYGQTHWIKKQLLRKIIIQTILATDLAERNKYYREWDARALGEYGAKHQNLSIETKFEDRLLFMQMIIKCCDLKHPTLQREQHLKWSEMVNEEFIQQDIKETELGLPHRMACTREPVAVAKSQAGFIRFLVMPTWTRLCLYVGGKYGKFWSDRLKAQITMWNESRRRAEFRRGGRTVMVMNRMKKMSTNSKLFAVAEEGKESSPPSTTDDISALPSQVKKKSIDDRQMVDKQTTKSLPYMPSSGN